jgi:hypothetical protein
VQKGTADKNHAQSYDTHMNSAIKIKRIVEEKVYERNTWVLALQEQEDKDSCLGTSSVIFFGATIH